VQDHGEQLGTTTIYHVPGSWELKVMLILCTHNSTGTIPCDASIRVKTD